MERKNEDLKLKIESIDGTTKLDWNAIPNACRYELWCLEKDSEYKMIFYGQTLSFIHYSAIPNVMYSYYIRAVDSYCFPICESNKVQGSSDLARPRVSGTINRKGIAQLSWTKVVGATKYEIYRKVTNKKQEKIGQTKLFDFDDDSCIIGIEYTYTIIAIANRGKKSMPSKEITLIGEYKATPLKLAISKNGFPLISWINPEGAIACHIYRTENPNIEPEEISCKINSTSYINTTAQKGKKYYYSIRMEYEGNILSLPSKMKEIRRPEYADDYFEITSEINKDGNLKLSWNELEDVSEYQVFASSKFSSNNYEKIFETKNNYYINSAYKFDAVRYYRIRAIHNDGLKGKMSKVIKIDPEIINKK